MTTLEAILSIAYRRVLCGNICTAWKIYVNVERGCYPLASFIWASRRGLAGPQKYERRKIG